ncbi:phage tail protein [Fusibacter paucivorans]|uniref:Phage tail protein n=1 Tax=Fusibacter paucivorans TaxID=76009 RepID=A0ABS5PPU4_9FIRM|nr:tail fiber protein [Fusibacter paucivorans]MBS7526927.1 phage tail protein [Fusibacter paucivorans]
MGQYIGEIKIFSYGKVPDGWLSCDGQTLLISDYMTLFRFIGITYGGDGMNTFRLPDLRGRAVNGASLDRWMGTSWGQETVKLSIANMPKHTHRLMACNEDANNGIPEKNYFGIARNNKASILMYGSNVERRSINADTIGNIGSNQAHNNIQPCLALNFCIAYEGTYPEWEPDNNDEGGTNV